MNKFRRTEIADVLKDFEALLAPMLVTARDAIEAVRVTAAALKERAEAIRDEEQEYLDAMPESLQSGERGGDAQAAIEQLETAIEALDALESLEIDSLDCEDEVVQALDEAKA